jgi:hypothetical protein
MYNDLNGPPGPSRGDGEFSGIWVICVVICQAAPHLFGWTRFLYWEVDDLSTWIFIGFGTATVMTFSVLTLIAIWDKYESRARKK